MKKIVAPILFVLLVLVGLIVTCPDKQKHVDAITDEMHSAVNDKIHEKMTENDDISQGLELLGGAFANTIVDGVVKNSISVKNYFVCSIGEISLMGKTKQVSIGFLGHVFTTFDADDIKSALNEKK